MIRTTIRNLRGRSNVGIVGGPRTGKTSLITILFRNYKRAERDALTWFTDMRELTTLEDLVEEFYVGMGARSENHSLNTRQNLKEFQKRLVIFIDAAERLAELPFNEEALCAALSFYLPSQNISLYLATTLPAGLVLKNRLSFPLRTRFIRCDLLPFTPEGRYDLIQKKLQFTGIHFSDPEIDKLIDQSKVNPADLQRLAAELFREKATLEEKGKEQIAYTGQARHR